MQTVCILGRQPALSLAELESRFNSKNISLIQPGIALLETDSEPDFDRLGGILKAGKLLTNLDYTEWHKLIYYLQTTLPRHLHYFPEGKITLGLSIYGLSTNTRQINAAALSLKKTAKKAGRSARTVPNTDLTLNTAQVLHNKLAGSNGLELLLIKNGNSTVLAQTKWVQDIEAYRRRDHERPMRDSRIGMLPPKLAQIIINLATGSPKSDDFTVLDPFCGTGVILQETLLMGYGAYGTDLEPRMVEYSQKNLEWLFSTFHLGMRPRFAVANLRNASAESAKEALIKVADATSHTWQPSFETIATETYLGRPFSSEPNEQTLKKVISDVNLIHKRFLQNLAQQTKRGFRMCIAIPAWHIKGRVEHLSVLDHLEELGYNRISFVHVKTSDLIYHREKQIVGRELVVISRK